MIAAVTVAAVLIIGTILAILAVSTSRKEAHGRHAIRARELADPADVTDPDGAEFIATLHEPPPLSVLARVRDGLLRLPSPRLDDTGEIPHAVGTWGKTVTELADEMAAKYLTAEVKR